LRRELTVDDAAGSAAPRLFLAWWADHYGDSQLALSAMRRWFEASGLPDATIWTPLFKNTRRTRGFKDLVSDAGIVDYWRASGDWGDYCRDLGDGAFDCH
jgi:hypothetical protein